MNLNKPFIKAIENGQVEFSQFENDKKLEPNLKRSLAATRLFKSLASQYGTRPANPKEWHEFLEWAVKTKLLTQQSSTWRITKSRLKNIFDHPLFHKTIEETEQKIRIEIDLHTNDSPGTLSVKKAKYFPSNAFNAIIRFLGLSKSEVADDAIRWLKVSLITGMRGIEWTKTEFNENNGIPFLRIVNTTKGSPFNNASNPLPPVRIFPLSHVSFDDIQLIKQHLRAIKLIIETQGNEGFRKHYEQITNLIYLQNRKLPDESKQHGSYGIYSCRHQLIANLKFTKKFSIEQIGRMMGQSTKRITERTYAKASKGYQSDTPFEDESSD